MDEAGRRRRSSPSAFPAAAGDGEEGEEGEEEAASEPRSASMCRFVQVELTMMTSALERDQA